MKNRIRIYILLIIIFLFVYVIYVYNKSVPDVISIGLSIIAIIISIVSVFKNELFPGELVVFFDNFHLVRAKALPPGKGITIQVMPTITFFNRGYGECPIKKVKMIVIPESRDEDYIFSPVAEVDMEAFIRQRKGLNSSNMKGSFCGFILESKKGISKSIVFTPLVSNDYPQFIWKPDIYSFEIHIQFHGEDVFSKYTEMRIEVTNKMLLMLQTNVEALYIM